MSQLYRDPWTVIFFIPLINVECTSFCLHQIKLMYFLPFATLACWDEYIVSVKFYIPVLNRCYISLLRNAFLLTFKGIQGVTREYKLIIVIFSHGQKFWIEKFSIVYRYSNSDICMKRMSPFFFFKNWVIFSRTSSSSIYNKNN